MVDVAKMTADGVVCPQLADEDFNIITADNIASLKLSSYERVPGTRVEISCLSRVSHVLNGTRVVTCLPTGQWDAQVPTCVARQPIYTGDDGITTYFTTQRPPTGSEAYEMLPYVVALSALGLACIILIILLSYALYIQHKSKKSNNSSTYDSTYASSASHLDLWIEMPGPRHFRCHELASSHDAMVHSLRYTNTYPPRWSGY